MPMNGCFATTNQIFWKTGSIGKFRLRPSSTPGGLAENIKQLHLLEYHEHSLQYFQAYTKANATPGPFSTPSLEPLSSPIEEGYNDTFITDEMMREVYMAFVERTRSEESDEYLRNLSPGICLSADNTFKAGGKATVADSSKARSKLVKSTLNFLNEGNEIVAWRFCQPASPAEMREVLEGFKKRCVELAEGANGLVAMHTQWLKPKYVSVTSARVVVIGAYQGWSSGGQRLQVARPTRTVSRQVAVLVGLNAAG
ncbi:hypothetical protein C8J57DRAFT_1244185 [Mycena rebaudengoi]|nr:hypothetical protein C8J57DRAFT_1244185 [Mycena rebaudengoi]